MKDSSGIRAQVYRVYRASVDLISDEREMLEQLHPYLNFSVCSLMALDMRRMCRSIKAGEGIYRRTCHDDVTVSRPSIVPPYLLL